MYCATVSQRFAYPAGNFLAPLASHESSSLSHLSSASFACLTCSSFLAASAARVCRAFLARACSSSLAARILARILASASWTACAPASRPAAVQVASFGLTDSSPPPPPPPPRAPKAPSSACRACKSSPRCSHTKSTSSSVKHKSFGAEPLTCWVATRDAKRLRKLRIRRPAFLTRSFSCLAALAPACFLASSSCSLARRSAFRWASSASNASRALCLAWRAACFSALARSANRFTLGSRSLARWVRSMIRWLSLFLSCLTCLEFSLIIHRFSSRESASSGSCSKSSDRLKSRQLSKPSQYR
mmetsp:Transcript_57727/g.130805  ORF Transcript_57727/g.130805 Transcript_57727/m.130805 type:complete len:302 (+) Transcript_57727:682-1587(+)